MEAIERGLKVMDTTALTLCMDNGLPIFVFNMGDERNVGRLLDGERIGTMVVTDGPSEETLMEDDRLKDAKRRMEGAWPLRERVRLA